MGEDGDRVTVLQEELEESCTMWPHGKPNGAGTAIRSSLFLVKLSVPPQCSYNHINFQCGWQ